MRPAEDAVRLAVGQNESPSFDEARWKAYAGALSAAQHGKCGFCESKVTNVADPDVEHYFPKSEVAWLDDDPQFWGTEVASLARLRGRKKKVLSNRGYWWKAYRWDNYLLACGVCNRKWKLTIFPVQEGDMRVLPPDEQSMETPLLLNPFSGPDPCDHLEFDTVGGITAKNGSSFGRETIKTCGLHRNQLRESRLEKATEVHELIDEFLAGPGDQRQRQILRRIVRMGDEAAIHCGMVRSVFRQRLEPQVGLTWVQLETLVQAIPART